MDKKFLFIFNTNKKKSFSFHFFKKKKQSKLTSDFKEYFSYLYFIVFGFVLCLFVLFMLSGFKNYFKIYKELYKLIDVYSEISNKYYGDLSKEKLVDSAVSSMLNSVGDTYTTYSDVENTIDFNENISGMYEGIGCTVSMNDKKQIVVVSVFGDSPASRAGIKKDDIFIKVDDKDFSNGTSNEISDYIRNNNKAEIKITIVRNGQEMVLNVKRSKVEMPTVTSKVIKKDNYKVGYINISLFSSVTYSQFNKEINKLEKDGIDGLVIDVRDNNGGYLSSVTDICSLFLKKGDIIYKLKSDKKIKIYKDKTKEKRDYPVAVLINKGSASASEILASAIKESYGGEVIGVNSFGKGTVQRTKQLKDGSMIKYTVQNWLTPNGKWINKVGVTPTLIVEYDKDSNNDNQLDASIDKIVSKIKK